MSRIRTSINILKQSGKVLQQHPKLLLFPVVNFIGLLFILAFYALPVFFDTNVLDLRESFSPLFQEWARADQNDSPQPVTIGQVTFGDGATNFPLLPLAFLYLLAMFLMTYINVAFYQQILQAFNGNPVSIRQGLAFAATKLRAIVMWSLLAGIVGLIIRQLEENVGFIGRWIVGLIGFAWSVACVFAIPVIIREEQQSNPTAYLKTSAAMIKKTWGEGLAGVAGISIITVALFLLITPLMVVLMIAMPFVAVQLLILMFVMIFALGYLSMVIRDIFLCGLYVYASEGVAPEAFEPALLEQGWKVKKAKK